MEEIVIKWLMRLALLSVISVLFLIILSIFVKGLPYISWDMISQTPKGGYYYGKEGGVLNAIIGSLYLAIGAAFLAFCIGLPVALLINVNLRKRKKFVNAVRFLLDLLWGVPSIVYGALGFGIMVFFGVRTSLLAGIITVTLFILPIMIRAMDEVLKNVPVGLYNASVSLGANNTQTSFKVYIKQCSSGIVTALIISFGRAIGDAASVLFTAGYTDNIPTSFNQPAATLPLAIFFQLSSPIEEVKGRAFASALILTVIILIISIVSRILSNKYHKHKIQ